MTKNEFLSNCWISYKKRLPPNEDIMILVWNYDRQEIVSGLARIFRVHQEQLKRDPELLKKWEKNKRNNLDRIAISGYKTSHWMFVPGPNQREKIV